MPIPPRNSKAVDVAGRERWEIPAQHGTRKTRQPFHLPPHLPPIPLHNALHHIAEQALVVPQQAMGTRSAGAVGRRVRVLPMAVEVQGVDVADATVA